MVGMSRRDIRKGRWLLTPDNWKLSGRPGGASLHKITNYHARRYKDMIPLWGLAHKYANELAAYWMLSNRGRAAVDHGRGVIAVIDF